ncbi:MAG: hypothetical protein H0T53_12500 [Herpetosiphonaceae bacterium]|nr:hypothetical protein [Herpetosiphonaceae bacterium]
MDMWRQGLIVDQAALEQYRALSDQQLYELFAAEKANQDSFAPVYPTRRRNNRNIADSRDQAIYMAQHKKLMAIQAAILERPSAASHPDFQRLVAMKGRGCIITRAGIFFLGVLILIVGALVYACLSMTILT